jgi:hypothetical protein
MKKFWKALGKALAKGAVWALENPDDVIAVVTTVKKVK